jgi:PPOX class probable F420-dependent enzyme
MASVIDAEAAAFLAEVHLAHLVTVGVSGAPHVAPVWYHYQDDTFEIFAGPEAVKVRNIRRDSRVALSIASEDEPYRYVLVEGIARIGESGVTQAVSAISVRYLGVERGKRFAQTLASSVLITINPRRLVTRISCEILAAEEASA